MKSYNNYTLTITRSELIRLMQACTHIKHDFLNDEVGRTHTGSIEMWKALHDKLDAQLEAQDAEHNNNM